MVNRQSSQAKLQVRLVSGGNPWRVSVSRPNNQPDLDAGKAGGDAALLSPSRDPSVVSSRLFLPHNEQKFPQRWYGNNVQGQVFRSRTNEHTGAVNKDPSRAPWPKVAAGTVYHDPEQPADGRSARKLIFLGGNDAMRPLKRPLLQGMPRPLAHQAHHLI